MQLEEVMATLETMGSEGTRRIYANHGAQGTMFGVSVGDMKKILKQTKKNHALAMELFATGNMDAQYLAALMADAKKVTPAELDSMIEAGSWCMVAEYGVAALAAESPHGRTHFLRWMDAPREHVAAAAWVGYGHWVSLKPDEILDLEEIKALLDRVQAQIQEAPNRVRYTMNGFVISTGSYVAALTDHAMAVARAIGKVEVRMGNTACKVPLATEYLQKIIDMGRIGKKRKHARC